MCTGTGAFGIGFHGSGGPRRGAFGPCPPKANHRGPTYLLPPKPKPGLLDPLGPIAEVDFFIRFQGPAGQIGPRGTDRAPQEESGLYRTNPGPAGWTRKTNQGPARQIWARKTNQGPVGQIKNHGTDQGLTIRIGAPQDGSGPRASNQGPHDESGSRGTSRAPRDG